MSRIPEDVNVAASKAQLVSIRNQSIAAGQFYTIADFLAANGVKKVNAAFFTPDAPFSNNLYISHIGTDNVGLSSNAPVPSSKATGTTSSEVFAGKARVLFQNADTVAHAIHADAVGWPI